MSADKSQTKEKAIKVLVNICRFLLAGTFLLSGFFKANDPLGTVYKFQDYFAAWSISQIPELFVLIMAFALALLEFAMGVYLLFGMRRKIVSRLTVVFMAFMTIITIYIFIANPVSDCGCFGDAIILTNGQTLLKNIVLLAAAIVVMIWWNRQFRLINPKIYWIVSTISLLGLLFYGTRCVYSLPAIDFRPFKIGTNLRKLTEVPQDERPQFDVKIIYERDGETLELSLDDDDPDSTWTYVETRRDQISKAGSQLVADFYIEEDGENITDDILSFDGIIFFLTAPSLEDADDSMMDRYNDLYDYSQQQNMEFYCLTASSPEQCNIWADYTGAEYIFYRADDRTLKTMVRANPGLMMIRDGIILKKWSNWNFPSVEEVVQIVTANN